MTLTHEKFVSARFDALEARFRTDVADSDVRLNAIADALGPIRDLSLLDLGCGKGRFARHFRERGANVVGLDPSRGMLNRALGVGRVQGSALRLPFAEGSFDAAIAVEVFEHLRPDTLDAAIAEAFRVLKPGGTLAIVDKNVFSLNAQRPYLPSLLVKWIDQRRGRWMYSHKDPVREIWFRPKGLAGRLNAVSPSTSIRHLLSPEEAGRWIFRTFPGVRLMTLWTATKPGDPSRA